MTSRNYLLLTPGPLTTSRTVKEAMLFDSCTWDDDYNIGVVEQIRQQLTALATASEGYTSVLLQGSGSYAVE
ncbi:2-aminoethylphosphonate--pyruvate transaminase, partial [Salmonella enterica]